MSASFAAYFRKGVSSPCSPQEKGNSVVFRGSDGLEVFDRRQRETLVRGTTSRAREQKCEREAKSADKIAARQAARLLGETMDSLHPRLPHPARSSLHCARDEAEADSDSKPPGRQEQLENPLDRSFLLG